METWLKAARDQAAKIGEDIQKQAILLADDAAQKGKREVSFREGGLGFELNGVYVASVDPDGQAHQLGVRQGDKLVSIAGYVIPENPKEESVKKWLDEMIRPGRLTFVSEAMKDGTISASAVVFPKEADFADTGLKAFPEQSWQEDDVVVVLPEMSAGKDVAISKVPTQHASSLANVSTETQLRAELYAARDEVQSLERELEDCRQECYELRHFAAEKAEDTSLRSGSREALRLRRALEQLEQAQKEAEEYKKKARDLQVRLETSTAACEELRLESMQSEDRAMEAMEGREQILEEEVQRLRASISALKNEHQASSRAATQELRESQDRAAELEKRLAQAATAKTDLERMVQEALARAVNAETQASASQQRYEGQLHKLQQRVNELQAELAQPASAPQANGCAPEPEEVAEEQLTENAVASGPQGIATGAFDNIQDVSELRAHIHVLEQQCSTLQRKLNARPIVYQAPPKERPSRHRSSGGILGVLRDIVEQLLRSFTERLLKRDAFLWVFYAHLLVLYAIAASCYAQTGGVSSSTLDVNLRAKAARPVEASSG